MTNYTKLYDSNIEPPRLDTLPTNKFELGPDSDVVTSSSGGDTTNHTNYMEYLELAWANHLGVVVDPTFFWHMILSEFAIQIKAKPEQYRHLFTTSDNKRDVVVYTNDPVVLPIDVIIAELNKLVPTDTTLFFPEFSTKTEQYTLATQIAFCDAVSPFYSYSMLMCGISSYDVRGTDVDWELLYNQTTKLNTILGMENPNLMITLKSLTNKSIRADVDFWISMFRLDRCGSGHQTEVDGWITEFYHALPTPKYVQNFSSHVGTVNYTYLPTGTKYTMYSGLFHSMIVDGTIIPTYGWMVKQQDDD